jgi:tetratricopeptide (TPR) repeat protein
MTRNSSDILAELRDQPDSEELHSDLLEAFANQGAWANPARFECILWLARNAPTSMWCGTPYSHINADLARDAYDEVLGAWRERANREDVSSGMLRNAALFIAGGNGDRAESLALLARAAELSPDDPKVWVDIGRVSPTRASRLSALLEAHQRGDRSENVRGWIATSAAAEGDVATAASFAREMLEDVQALVTEYGEHAKGPPGTEEMWPWAISLRTTRDAAYALVRAVSTHAYFTHQAHTAMGVVALRSGDAAAAIAHLDASCDILPDARLGAYGPDMTLVRELCLADQWAPAEAFLRRWGLRSPHDEVDEWLDHVARREVPSDDEAA